jgi:hypothetical protein
MTPKVNKKKRFLVGFERSGKVRDALRKSGHEAVSCDLQDTISPGPHYKGSVFDIMGDGWDCGIFHPPCTHLAVSGAAWFEAKRKDGRQQQGIDLFMRVVKEATDKIPKWAIENPVGIMSRLYRPYDQLIQPWMFGDPFQKATCLWLHNLQPLFHWEGESLFNFTHTHTHHGEFTEWTDKTGRNKKQATWSANAKKADRSNIRSQTFPGIAAAMAEQWGNNYDKNLCD